MRVGIHKHIRAMMDSNEVHLFQYCTLSTLTVLYIFWSICTLCEYLFCSKLMTFTHDISNASVVLFHSPTFFFIHIWLKYYVNTNQSQFICIIWTCIFSHLESASTALPKMPNSYSCTDYQTLLWRFVCGRRGVIQIS